MAGRLADKRILITAAGQGMDRATAWMCAAEGARVLATDRDAGLLANWHQSFGVDIHAMFHVTRAALPGLLRRAKASRFMTGQAVLVDGGATI